MLKKHTITDKKLVEVVEVCFYESLETASISYGLSAETLNRYKREFKKRFPERYDKLSMLQSLSDSFSADDINTIIKSGKHGKKSDIVYTKNFEGERIKFGFMTDTHMGSMYFDEGYFKSAIQEMKRQECNFICHTGDVTDGLSNRPNHIYELNKIGYEAQKEYSLELLSEWDKKWYIVSGNHDGYYIMHGGAYIVKDICENLPDADYIGESMGDIIINGIRFNLWHGIDGSSYATSYRVQKLIEAFTGGEKPQILLCGHTHKQGYFFERNIHAFSGGALSRQSKFMKGKKLSNHAGFWIIDMNVKDKEILSIKSEWFPFYK